MSVPPPSPDDGSQVARLEAELLRLQWVTDTQAMLADHGLDLEHFMQVVVDRVPQVTPAQDVILELIEGEDMVYRAVTGGLKDHLGMRLKRGSSLSGLCVAQREALYCRDSETDPRVDREATRRVGLRSMICVPLMREGVAVGVLKALAPWVNAFDMRDIALLDLLAKALGTAMARQVNYEAMRAAQQAAEAAAAAKAEFLANMSHEIRTPLTSVIGFSGLLQQATEPDGEARRYADRINAAAKALLAVVNDILDFSKLEAGEVELKPQLTDPAELAREALSLFHPQAAARGLKLTLEPPETDTPPVMVDPQALRQVLLNLLGNAVKFTEAGGVTLRLTAGGGRIGYAVVDTGAGMTPEQQEKLFQRFSQVDSSTTRRHGGTGLGLAICRGLVQAMGGEIGVTSAPGQGSTFHFEIPAPPANGPRLAGDPPGFDITGVRVLVVDDNPTNRELARAMLEALGAEVHDATDGLNAVEAAQLLPYDVILMDMRMPRLDGPAATARIRSEPGPNQDVPILVFSAGDPDARMPSGFDGAISKPVTPGALLTAIGQAMEAAYGVGEGETALSA